LLKLPLLKVCASWVVGSRCTEFDAGQDMVNVINVLHGGCSMYLVDMCVASLTFILAPYSYVQIVYVIDLRTRQPRRRLRRPRGFAVDAHGLP